MVTLYPSKTLLSIGSTLVLYNSSYNWKINKFHAQILYIGFPLNQTKVYSSNNRSGVGRNFWVVDNGKIYSSTFKYLMSLRTCTGIKVFRHGAIAYFPIRFVGNYSIAIPWLHHWTTETFISRAIWLEYYTNGSTIQIQATNRRLLVKDWIDRK